MKKDKIVKKL